MSLQRVEGFPEPRTLGPSVLTIGAYDGLHRGHMALLGPVIETARREGLLSVMATFEPHPRCVLSPKDCPPNLTTLEEKAWLLEDFEGRIDRAIEELMASPGFRQIAARGGSALMATNQAYRSNPQDVYEALGSGAAPATATRGPRRNAFLVTPPFPRLRSSISRICVGPRET